MPQGCSNLVLYSSRVIAEACSFGAGVSGSQAYLHLHHLLQTFPWKIFLAALNHISDSYHAPGYSRTELWHWVYGMMLLAKIGTYAKAKCRRIDNSNGKGTMTHTGRYDSSDKIKLPYSLVLLNIACNKTQNIHALKVFFMKQEGFNTHTGILLNLTEYRLQRHEITKQRKFKKLYIIL